MSTVFSNVHGFNLQLPYNNAARPYPDEEGEWITITKNQNELPTVKLRTIVLYYRNNGNKCTTSEPDDSYNYRFYNDLLEGGLDDGQNSIWQTADGETNGWQWGDIAYANGDSAGTSLTEYNALNTWWNYPGGYQRNIGADHNQTNGNPGSNESGCKIKYYSSSNKITKIDIHAAGSGVGVGDVIFFWARTGLATWIKLYHKVTLGDLKNTSYVSNGRQLGWIWGFPLFNVGNNATNWPRFNSCITSNGDISGNETMLVDLSPQRNIIVLDWSGQSFTANQTGYEAIRYKQDQAQSVDSFYMTLRVKSSTENLVDYTGGSSGAGKNGHWNFRNNNTILTNRWATLVQYEYECDIIGPKSMLDLTLNSFMFSDSNAPLNNVGHPIYQNTWNSFNAENNFILADPRVNNTLTSAFNQNYGISNFVINIITGNNDSNQRLYLTSIFKTLGHSYENAFGEGEAFEKLQVKQHWNHSSSYTVITLIGGWYNAGKGSDNDEQNRGYYGDKWATGNNTTDGNADTRRTQMLPSSGTQTEGWKRFTTLKTASAVNVWTNNYDTDTYEFNNILWCSLQSPRKLPVSRYANNTTDSFNEHRFVTNFIDISANTDNKIIGGGYGRYSNTIDMGRLSVTPYYSSSSNPNTVTINTFDVNNDLNYNSSPANVNLVPEASNYFKVSYKLLVPPQNNETYDIKFNMGRRNQVGVTTFFRFSDMSGVCNPPGKSNLDAERENESITLTWSKDSVNELTGDISINTIYFTDVASGFDKVIPQFDISGGVLLNANSSSNYDISFNVFQTHFYPRTTDITFLDREELPYIIKAFDSNILTPQFIDISYVPLNYQPYRYINYTDGNVGKKFLKKSKYSSPLLIKTEGEKLKFNIGKYWTRTTTVNAKNIDPSNNINLPTIDIDISYNNGNLVYDNSYSVTNAILNTSDILLASVQEIVGIGKQDGPSAVLPTIQNDKEKVQITPSTGNGTFDFYAPDSLKLGNNFIPDYWRLPDKLNTLYTVNQGNFYYYYEFWVNQIETHMILDVLSISLKTSINNNPQQGINYLLLNSNKSKRDTNEWSIVAGAGNVYNNGSINMIYDVQGTNGLPVNQYLNKKPIIVQLLTTSNGPFGVNGKAFIGNKAGGNTSGNPPADETRGINVPYPAQTIGTVSVPANNSYYNINNFLPNALRQGNGIGGTNLSGTASSYNGKFNINMSAWNDSGSGIQNSSYNGTSINPTPLNVLIVDLSNVKQTNGSSTEMINDQNNAITINWTSFYFSKDPNWDKTELGDVFWTVIRYNLATGQSAIVINEKALPLNGNNEYTFTDTNVRIYDKFKYTISGKFKWSGVSNLILGTELPSLPITGFTTPECFACKFNRFQYGRFNTTSTNLKLFRPLLINTPQGQVDQFGQKTCGGGCIAPNNPGLNLFSGTTRTSTNNNIYSDTTNQLSKKQTYVVLSKNRFRPFR